ncbi:hypothetical protein T12_7774 [Trichinella patagoniensis]|uniref:Uncharacterized protein n=1 Tax=Trichinella patagoniensis TaxID=990121 RepID=A0A0V1AGI1_9BILA|nr:hypothetical protein T12_7774 [Trichinella patagoniensis]
MYVKVNLCSNNLCWAQVKMRKKFFSGNAHCMNSPIECILLVPALISFLNYMPPFKLLFSIKVLSKMPHLIFYAIEEAEFITI